MDNKKRSVHNSGPLGMLMNSGQIQEVNEEINRKQDTEVVENTKPASKYFLKESGIEFAEDELLYIDPKECEPWEFANRHQDEMGDIEGLMASIEKNKQLQPALIRDHPKPHDNIKYEVIFGRRRHQACLNLAIPLLVIKKPNMNLMEALSCQHSENKCRDDVSPYSDALIYKKLLDNRLVKSQKALAESLNISQQTLSDVLSFAKLPERLINLIPNPHKLSTKMSLKMVSLIEKDPSNLIKLLERATEIGTQLDSAKSLDTLCKIKKPVNVPNENSTKQKSKVFSSLDGIKLFSFKLDKNGSPNIVVNKDLLPFVGEDELCESIKLFLEDKVSSKCE